MKKILSLILFTLNATSLMQAKTLIITYNYDNPEFIKMQHYTFKRFVQDEYEFVVFSDAPTETAHNAIATMCKKYGIQCIRVPQHIHEDPYYLPLNIPEIYQNHITPSNVRHVHSIQYSLDVLGFDHEGVVLLIDTDMILVRPLNITNFMKNCDIAALMRGSSNKEGATIMYCWPAITFLNMQTLPDKKTLNFNCGWVNGCSADSGGATHYYLQEHPEIKIKGFSSFYSGDILCSDRFYTQEQNHKNINTPNEDKIAFWQSHKFNEKEIKFLLKNPDTIQFLMEGDNAWFFHYRGGTNYENLPASYHKQKKNLIAEYLKDIMQ